MNGLQMFNGENLSSLVCSHYMYEPTDTAACDGTTDLAPYIEQAEIACYGKPSITRPIFADPENRYTVPQLHKNQINRIIVYVGSFKPPHLGHLEYICHTFLRADE